MSPCLSHPSLLKLMAGAACSHCHNPFSFLKRTEGLIKSYHRSVYNAINAHVTLNLVCCAPCHACLSMDSTSTFSPASFFIKSHGCLAHLRCSSTYIYIRIASNYTIATYSCRINITLLALSVSRPCCTIDAPSAQIWP